MKEWLVNFQKKDEQLLSKIEKSASILIVELYYRHIDHNIQQHNRRRWADRFSKEHLESMG